jgi:hypothetical protein
MERGTWRLDDVLFAAEATRGNISAAAERLGCSRLSLYKYLARTPRAQQAFLDWRERLVDLAEDRLWECVDERQPWAIALVLKTRGRARGWGEQPTVPVSTPDGVQIYLPVKGSIAEPIKFYLPMEDAAPEPVKVDLQWGDTAPVATRQTTTDDEIGPEEHELLKSLQAKVRELEQRR